MNLNNPGMSSPPPIKKLDVSTLRLNRQGTKTVDIDELERVLVELTNKLNKVIDIVNTI